MNRSSSSIWQDMLRRSFQPRDWFTDGHTDRHIFQGGKLMWVYRLIVSEWTVGFYAPDKVWHADSVQPDKETAAKRCHYLNGGDHRNDP